MGNMKCRTLPSFSALTVKMCRSDSLCDFLQNAIYIFNIYYFTIILLSSV